MRTQSSYLEHAEYILESNDHNAIYNVETRLFDAYIDASCKNERNLLFMTHKNAQNDSQLAFFVLFVDQLQKDSLKK